MHYFRARALRPLFLGWLVLITASLTPVRAADRTFTTSTELSTEARTLTRLLEEVHYNRDAVKTRDYLGLIPDYMSDLDGQRLFFLGSDKAAFTGRYDKNLYWNISQLGNIDAAYDIFNVYNARVAARVNWILDELKKDIDLTTHETYEIDRSKTAWPATPKEADDLWRRRLKFEILAELLNQKSTNQTEAKDSTSPPATTPVTPKAPDSATNPEHQQKEEVLKKTAPGQLKDEGVQQAAAPVQAGPPDPAKAMAAAKEVVRKRYERMLKNLDDIDGSDLAEMFLTSVAGLYDPHSSYFSADTYDDFNIQMRLSLVGIGALLNTEDDYCVVKEIVPGGPADLSKLLHQNDKIISVAQSGAEPVDIIGMKLRRIVNLIRGGKGTKVRLTIIPSDATDSSTRKEITITRDIVKLNSARAHAAIFDVPSDDGKSTVPLGVISLPTFYGPIDSDDGQGEKTSATKDVAALIKQLQAAGIKGIILDLRHNGGGLLSEAIDLTGLFIGRGPVVQVKDFQGDIKVDSDDDSAIAYSGPLAVLVDRFSASASEIVTGALQDYGRAVIIGDSSTHGKGSVQTVYEMRDIIPQLMDSPLKTIAKAGAAKITIQKFYLPDGSSTQLKGVVPDIVLPSIDDYLPIGEKDLPHALAWDDIPSSFFDGAPLSPKIIEILRAASLARQQKFEEFTYLKRNLNWFKAKEDQKYVPLDLEDRQKEKSTDDSFRKEMNAERERLAKDDYKFREFRLGPPLPPTPPAPQKSESKPSTDSDDDDSLDLDNNTFTPLDIPLRESLRVLNDAIVLGAKTPQLWAAATAKATPATTPQ